MIRIRLVQGTGPSPIAIAAGGLLALTCLVAVVEAPALTLVSWGLWGVLWTVARMRGAA